MLLFLAARCQEETGVVLWITLALVLGILERARLPQAYPQEV